MRPHPDDDRDAPPTRPEDSRRHRQGDERPTIDSIAARPDAPTIAEQLQPGVDPEQAARSYSAGVDLRRDGRTNDRRNTIRFLVPAAALAVVMLGFFGIGLTMQLVVPLIGIVVTVVLIVAMIVVARRTGDERRRMRTLGRLLVGMGVALAVLGVLYYVIAASGFVASVPPV